MIVPLNLLGSIKALAAAPTPVATVEVWKRTDIILNSKKEYSNPYLDVEIDAVFEHTDGTEIKLFGFWNGDNEWRVRFSPTKTGIWSYRITSSDTSNEELHDVTGTVAAVPNTGASDIDQHGFVRISDNKRYFAYDDGTPFYWLGDTNWQAPNYVSTTQCNYPNCKCQNQFKHEVDDRLDKGFNVYQTYFDSGENDGGGQLSITSEPSLWIDKYNTINPDTFTEKIDGMFDYLADNGMVIALGYGVHSHSVNGMGKTVIEQVSRYLTARYASYPVVWFTAQEITGEPQFDVWKASAEIVDAGDGYNHPQGAHMFPMDNDNEYARDLDEQSWHEWWGLQNGHGPIQQSKDLYKSYWDNDKVKPYLELEANYEDISCGGFNGYDASRISAWRTNLLGSYGFTYGVTGVWANSYSTNKNKAWYIDYNYEPWYMGLDKPGSWEMKYLRNFFEYVQFNELIPRFNDTDYSNCIKENKVVASTEDAKTYVAYFYNKDLTTGTLGGLNTGDQYTARWYNPLTGKFIDEATGIVSADGTYQIPAKPSSSDWAFVLTSKDLGVYETEEIYNDPFINRRENLAIGAAATASSDNSSAGNFGPDAAVDGDYTTFWCADSGNMPQWLKIDMGESKAFKEVDILMHRGNEYRTEKISYALKGSQDGASWDVIHEEADQRPTVVDNMDRLRVTQDGNYRYLLLEFNDITTNWATVYEFGVYADEADDEEPTIPDPTNINHAAGALATASSASHSNSAADKSVDGKADTYWCASSGEMPQWLQYDLGEERKIGFIHMYMVGGTSNISYVLEGSNDGNDWVLLKEEEDRELGSKKGLSFMEIETTGSYQYLKLTFNKVEGNWATMSGFEVYTEAVAPLPDDEVPEYTGVLQTPLVKSVGSGIYNDQDVYSNSASHLFDGDINTEWKPYGPIGSQTILMDLLQKNTLQGIVIKLGDGAYLPKYRIEGSNNGTDWKILTDATLRAPQAFNKGGRTVVYETLSGEYRYVKLLWLNAPSNSTNKKISEIELYANQETPAHPQTTETDAMKSLYYEWKNKNNASQKYTDASWKELQICLANAGRLLMNPYAQSGLVDQAAQALRAAVAGLSLTVKGLKQELQSLVSDVEGKREADYTAASWSKFAAALQKAKEMLADSEADQSLLEDALTVLQNAYQALEKPRHSGGGSSGNTVQQEPIKVEQVKLSKESARLFIKDKTTLEATVLPDDAADKKVSWMSSDVSVASVDKDGKVTAKHVGTATITAKAEDDSGKSASCEITVVKATVKLNAKSTQLQVKQSTQAIKATGLQKGDKVKQWTSSKKSVATVDKNGKIVAKNVGTTTISVVTVKGAKASVKLSVVKGKVVTKSIKANVKKLSLKLGKTYQLVMTRNPVTATEKITYKSSKPKIATVNDKGKITAKTKGVTTITIKSSNGKTYKVQVTVK